MAKNANLTAAKRAKNDEFYTQLTDIEKELKYYKDQLRGKIVFCNCDDPEWSNFWRYFDLNFDHIGLKGLIATHYDPVKPTYKLEIFRDGAGNKMAPVRTDLRENGDFRSPECVELLRQCDVVVTNPPFSLFREYVALLVREGKKFVIIGNMNAITYKEIFPLLKDNQMWIGYMSPKMFLQPDGTQKSFGNVLWYTNIDIKKRHEPLTLFRRYYDDPSKYPKYDNYDAIEVGKVADIPEDYYEHIGVPITFLDKYCPEQFEILGLTCTAETMDIPVQVGQDFVKAYREAGGTGHVSANMYGVTLFGDSSREREREREASGSVWQDNYPAQKVKITQAPDGRYEILPQNGIDLRALAEKYAGEGFEYCSGAMLVPVTYFDKYCPEQFKIIGSPDGRVVPDGWRCMSSQFLSLYRSQGGKGHLGRLDAGYITFDGIAKPAFKRILIRRI